MIEYNINSNYLTLKVENDREKKMKQLKPRCIEMRQQMFPDTIQIVAQGLDVCYFQLEPFERFVKESNQALYQEDNKTYREFPSENWNVGFFVDSTQVGMIRLTNLGYFEIASFVESYEHLFPKTSANSHFVTRASGIIGKYTEEGIRKRIAEDDSRSEQDKKRTFEHWRKNYLGNKILGDSLIFHVPEPSTRECAKNLAEKVIQTWIQMTSKKIYGRKEEIKQKYYIDGLR